MTPPPQSLHAPPRLDSFKHEASCNNKEIRESLLGSYFREEDEFNNDEDDFGRPGRCRWKKFCRTFCRCGLLVRKVKEGVSQLWEFGRDDQRKAVFAGKMGLALGLVSLLIYFKEPSKDLARYSIWAVLTVVVVFEFSIGATLSKGLNRALGTLCAGVLGLGAAALSSLAGDWEELAIVINIFVVGSFTTFVKHHPKMKPYEYGFRVFVITFCLVMVSGYNTRIYIKTVVNRFLLIALGAAIGFSVNICIYPIWAGEDLHNLVVKNFMSVANSLEGCVDGYLRCVAYERIPSKILTYQASDDPVYSGYRAAVESTSQEETLLGFAIWEPPHGPYRLLKYPWRSYVNVSGALRHCAFMVMALHGCILSEIQAPPERRLVFKSELQRVGTEGAKVLRELGNRVKTMTKLDSMNILFEVHEAAEKLQKKIDSQSYLLVNSESWEIGKRPEGLKEALENFRNKEKEKERFRAKSLSETWLDLHLIDFSKRQDASNTSNVKVGPSTPTASATAEQLFSRNISWPARRASFVIDSEPKEEDTGTYESASAMSLVTFASQLIEFVARLQYLVDEFEELSEKANFKDPLNEPAQDESLWSRLINCRCCN